MNDNSSSSNCVIDRFWKIWLFWIHCLAKESDAFYFVIPSETLHFYISYSFLLMAIIRSLHVSGIFYFFFCFLMFVILRQAVAVYFFCLWVKLCIFLWSIHSGYSHLLTLGTIIWHFSQSCFLRLCAGYERKIHCDICSSHRETLMISLWLISCFSPGANLYIFSSIILDQFMLP